MWTEPHDNNAPIEGYRVTYEPPSFLQDSNSSAVTLNSSIERLEVVGLHPGVLYNFTVVAFNDIGSSTPSAVEQALTLEERECVCVCVLNLMH